MNPGIARVACVGAGYFAAYHYDAWRRIEGVELVGAVDPDRAAAVRTGCRPFESLEALLTAESPDLLDIATPPDTHLALLREAVSAGVRWIICQKPFCGSLDGAREAVELARASGATIVVHDNFRFQPWYRRIRALLDAGVIGELLQISFRLRPGDGQGADAYLARQPYFRTMPQLLVHETAVHWIDTFRFLMGDPDWVFADLQTLNPVIRGEDAGLILFGYDDGRRALFDGNRLLDHAADDHRLTLGDCLVEGTGGSLALSGDGALRFRPFRDPAWQCVLPAWQGGGFGGDCVLALQSHVVHAWQHGAVPENTAAEYLPVREIEAAVYRSAQHGRREPVSQGA